jgi:hypothetical protein
MAASSSSSRQLLMSALTRYFSNPAHMTRVLPYINCTADVSLRLIDWFVTNYAKKHNIIMSRSIEGSPVHFNVYLNYRTQLKAYSKQQFDPFRRRDRVMFYYSRDGGVETTIGQLNFFRWLLQHGLLDYINAHASDIEQDMLQGQKKVAAHGAAHDRPVQRKKRNTSSALGDHAAHPSRAVVSMTRLAGPRTVSFD